MLSLNLRAKEGLITGMLSKSVIEEGWKAEMARQYVYLAHFIHYTFLHVH